MIEARINTHLRAKTAQIPHEAQVLLAQALTFRNPEKIKAKKEKIWGWQDLPDNLYFWEEEGEELILPRGFLTRFEQGLAALNLEVSIKDERVFPRARWADGIPPIELREHQPAAVEDLLTAEQGIYEAPPGSGKTVTVLELARRINVPTLIITHKKEIADQWRLRAQTFLGIETGMIGDGKWDEKLFTIALQQTLWSKHKALDSDNWWAGWGFVCLDECHHVPAETFAHVFQRFPALYRIGVSGTPDKGSDVPYGKIYIGPVVHQTDKRDLVGKVLVQPEIHVVRTQFTFPFRSTSYRNGRVVRNNYGSLIKKLVEDEDRNSLIAQTILGQRGHHNLVLSKQLKHLDILREYCLRYGWPEDAIYMLRGKESMEERTLLAETIPDLEESLIFSTLAEEALDIPALDRLHMAFPARDPDLYKQRIGRVERIHPGKEDAIVFDYVDFLIGVIKSQFRTRRMHIYNAEDLRVTGVA